jgi:hypothetical protein
VLVIPSKACLAHGSSGASWAGLVQGAHHRTLFRRLTSSSQYLASKVMASLPEHPLMVEHWSSTRLPQTDKPHLNMSIVLQEKGWAKKMEMKEKGKVFSVPGQGSSVKIAVESYAKISFIC